MSVLEEGWMDIRFKRENKTLILGIICPESNLGKERARCRRKRREWRARRTKYRNGRVVGDRSGCSAGSVLLDQVQQVLGRVEVAARLAGATAPYCVHAHRHRREGQGRRRRKGGRQGRRRHGWQRFGRIGGNYHQRITTNRAGLLLMLLLLL